MLHGAHAGAAADPAGWLLPGILVLGLMAGYLLGVARVERRRARPWSRWRLASWATGVTLLAAALAPPITAQAHTDPRAHMVTHLLLGMYAPLALVLAAPLSLLLGATSPATGRRVTGVLRHPLAHALSHPVTAGLLTTGGLWALYLTPLYALSLEHPVIHAGVNAHFVLAGFLFAWAIAGPDPAPRRPGMAVRLAVLLVAAGAHAYLAKLLYARAGTGPPGTSFPATDLEAAAQWMYYGGDVAEILLVTALCAGWYSRRTVARQRAAAVTAPRPRPTW